MKTFGLATVLALLLAAPAVAATDENISIETLLKAGWQVAGYAAANQFAVESAMILLRHADQSSPRPPPATGRDVHGRTSANSNSSKNSSAVLERMSFASS